MSTPIEPIDMQRIVGDVVTQMAQQAVERVLVHHAGYGITDAVHEIVKEEARKICQTPEMQKKIKEHLLYWLERDTGK